MVTERVTPRTAEATDHALEEALRERVTRLVALRGVTPARVRAAVSQVVAALPAARAASVAGERTLLATFAGTRPDLASALHVAGAAAGVGFMRAGRGSAGRHTVVAALVPVASRDKLAALAAAVGASVAVGEAPTA